MVGGCRSRTCRFRGSFPHRATNISWRAPSTALPHSRPHPWEIGLDESQGTQNESVAQASTKDAEYKSQHRSPRCFLLFSYCPSLFLLSFSFALSCIVVVAMHLPSLGLIIGVAVIINGAALIPRSHIVHEKRLVTSSKWVKREKLSSRTLLPMRIGLKQQNLEMGEELLMGVSHPDSKNFGKHWTSEEVVDFFAPEQKTVDNVRNWLVDSGIDAARIAHSDNKGWLAFDATVEEAESLLHTEYHLYEHTAMGETTAACESYHVPAHISEHVDYITPGVKLFVPTRRNRSKKRGFGMTSGQHAPLPPPKASFGVFPRPPLGNVSDCDVRITPDCIKALYKVPPVPLYPAGPRSDNSLGVFEEGDYYAQTDLDYFFGNYTPNIPKGTHPIPAFIDGADAPTDLADAGGESDLDFELIYPLIYPQTVTLYQTDDAFYATNPNSTSTGGFNTFLDALDGSYCTYEGGDTPLDPVYPDPNPGGYNGTLQCGIYKPTNVISISYGGQEYDLPASYQQRQCNEFLKLGLQGHSIFFASGDDGVAGPGGDDNKNGCLGPNSTVFSPAWPNSCPWVTNVGATKVYPNHTVWDPESAVVDPAGHPYHSAFSSGGGFSNIYPIPDYQSDAVGTFFRHHDPPYPHYRGNSSFGQHGGLYNRVGRGYPDVAANGDNIAVYNSGDLVRSGGTSASTPIFASIINRINEERLNAGKSTVGFINPSLYSNPWILNDITNGTNPGCGTVGFSAVQGWDPVTGLGTPNYPKMLDFFMSLP